jgi:hypothetical protein
LAPARKYLELNSATISVESIKSQGSIFTITFPTLIFASAVAAATVTPQAAAEGVPVPSSEGHYGR